MAAKAVREKHELVAPWQNRRIANRFLIAWLQDGQNTKLVLTILGQVQATTTAIRDAKLANTDSANLVLQQPLPIECPVRLLHGDADIDVPWTLSLALMHAVRSTDAELVLLKGAGHRSGLDAIMLAATLPADSNGHS